MPSETSVWVHLAAEHVGVKVQSCGLNADWSVAAWAIGDVTPNRTDGAYYLLDCEDGTFALARRFYQLEDGYDPEYPNPYDTSKYGDPGHDSDGANDDIVTLATAPLTLDGAEELLEVFMVAMTNAAKARVANAKA